MADADNPYWVDRERAAVAEPRVQVRYAVPPRLPLLLNGTAGDTLTGLTVASGSQRTVFRVTPEQWAAVVDAAGGWPVDSTTRAEDDLARGRQGALSEAIVRLAVERHAMDLAMKHYEKEGWRVDDVSGQASFDLLCTTNGLQRELHVEVKGTTSAGHTVRLTRNEVKHATDGVSPVSLFVVADVLVERVGSEARASGGTVRILDPWDLDPVDLQPTQYDYRVPSAEGTQLSDDL